MEASTIGELRAILNNPELKDKDKICVRMITSVGLNYKHSYLKLVFRNFSDIYTRKSILGCGKKDKSGKKHIIIGTVAENWDSALDPMS